MYVYITMGLHRKAGFHWRKRASHCVRRKVWKTIGNWRQGYQLGCLIWSWENVYVPGEKFERFWPRGEILLRLRSPGKFDFATLQWTAGCRYKCRADVHFLQNLILLPFVKYRVQLTLYCIVCTPESSEEINSQSSEDAWYFKDTLSKNSMWKK